MRKLRMILLVFALIFAAQSVMTVQPVQAKTESQAKKKSGLKKEKGNYYYYKNGKKVKKKWLTVKKKKYYFTKNGAAATGWTKISGKAYYFNNKGVMQKSKTVDGIKLNKKGNASMKSANVQLKFAAIAVVSKQKTLQNCYKYVTKFTYLPRNYSITKKGWEVTYALNALNDKKGNCYSYATAFAMLARECGYDAKIVTGTMVKNGGKEQPHAWVEIDGKVYDPQSENNMKIDCYAKTYDQITAIVYTAQKRI